MATNGSDPLSGLNPETADPHLVIVDMPAAPRGFPTKVIAQYRSALEVPDMTKLHGQARFVAGLTATATKVLAKAQAPLYLSGADGG